jgi:hypothetical protein
MKYFHKLEETVSPYVLQFYYAWYRLNVICLKKLLLKLKYVTDYEVSKTKEPTILEFDLALQPQNAQENLSRKVQHSQMDNGYKHKALTHSQTNNQIPAEIKTLNQKISKLCIKYIQ